MQKQLSYAVIKRPVQVFFFQGFWVFGISDKPYPFVRHNFVKTQLSYPERGLSKFDEFFDFEFLAIWQARQNFMKTQLSSCARPVQVCWSTVVFRKIKSIFLGVLIFNGNLTDIRSLDKISWKRNFHRLCAACASLLKHSSHQRRTHCASAQCGNFFWQLRFSS
jgi:hypothetical protein